MNRSGPEGLGTLFSTLAALASPAHSQLVDRPLYGQVAPLGVREWVRDAAHALADMLVTWSERQRQRRLLRELDDHVLRDIGLSRAQVEAEADKPFWRP